MVVLPTKASKEFRSDLKDGVPAEMDRNFHIAIFFFFFWGQVNWEKAISTLSII